MDDWSIVISITFLLCIVLIHATFTKYINYIANFNTCTSHSHNKPVARNLYWGVLLDKMWTFLAK